MTLSGSSPALHQYLSAISITHTPHGLHTLSLRVECKLTKRLPGLQFSVQTVCTQHGLHTKTKTGVRMQTDRHWVILTQSEQTEYTLSVFSVLNFQETETVFHVIVTIAKTQLLPFQYYSYYCRSLTCSSPLFTYNKWHPHEWKVMATIKRRFCIQLLKTGVGMAK